MNLKNTERHWRALGKGNPLLAILTYKDKRHHGWKESEFFETGKREVENVFKHVKDLGLEFLNDRALDFGCGVGRLTQAISPNFKETHGVDISEPMITLANKYNEFGERCKYHLNTDNDMKIFTDNYFDFILSKITLQHMEPRYAKNYIKEFVRILKPGGVLFFQLPTEPVEKTPKQTRTKAFFKKSIPKPALNFYYNFKRLYNPVIEMHGTPESEVVKFLVENGGKIVKIGKNQDAGEKWLSLDYSVTK